MTAREPSTGALHNVSIDVQLTDQPLPLMFTAPDWEGARAYLDSAEFREVAARIHFITITSNRGSTRE
jgi:hypothetical protein